MTPDSTPQAAFDSGLDSDFEAIPGDASGGASVTLNAEELHDLFGELSLGQALSRRRSHPSRRRSHANRRRRCL